MEQEFGPPKEDGLGMDRSRRYDDEAAGHVLRFQGIRIGKPI